MKWNVIRVMMGLFVAVLFGMGGCGGGSSNNAPNNKTTAANAGPPQNVVAGSLVTLNGSQSTGADGSLITYQWSMTTKPVGSAATIINPTTVNPTFTPDLSGQYSLKLVITDTKSVTSEATVTITASVANAAPVANAGTAQSVVTGAVVTLDGSASSDANGDLLTYSWAFTSKPAGSSAALSSATVAKPTFTADVSGAYVLNLVVNDGKENSSTTLTTVTAAVASAVTISVDTAQTGSAVRDLFGVNKNPRAALSVGSTTINNVATLYKELGVTQVRVHDSGVDLCGAYKDATLYDMTTAPPTVLTGTCTTTGVGAQPQLKWNINNVADVNNPDNYNFTELDRVIANIQEAGASLYLRLGQTYNGPSNTDDPDAWSKVAVNIYKHIIGQFKPSGVSMDPVTVEVYNEPDGGFWKGNKGAFMIYFNNTVDGVRSAAASAGKSVRIGGPGFTNEFVTHSATTSNVASTFVETATLARLDFLSAHHYNGCANATLARAVNWFDSVRSLLATKGYPQSKPLDITEYNIGLGTACGNSFYGEAQTQSFTSGMLTLMQQVDEWNIERAMFYSGFPLMGLITNSSAVGSVIVNPSAWAFWAHSQLKGGTQVKTETCVSGSACVSGKSAASSPVISVAAKLSTGGYRIIVTNTTSEAKNYTLHLKGLTGTSVALQVRTPLTTAQTVTTGTYGTEYAPTTSSIAELLAKITTQNVPLSVTAGVAQTTLTLPAWSLNVVDIRP